MTNGSGSRGTPPPGHRAMLARVGGRAGIPQKLTDWGVHSGPSASTFVQTGSCGDFSEEQSRLKGPIPLTTGVGHRQLVQLVPRHLHAFPAPAIGQEWGQQPRGLLGCPGPTGRDINSGSQAPARPWVCVQASPRVLQHLARRPRW